MALGLVEQSFIQGIMANKSLTLKETLKLYNRCERNGVRSNRQPKRYVEYYQIEPKIEKINRSLLNNGFQLRPVYSPWEKKNFVVLINSLSDESGHNGNTFNKSETNIFFELIECLLENDGQLLRNECYDIIRSQQKFTISESEQILLKFEKKFWFSTIRSNVNNDVYVCFGSRSIAEIQRVRQFARHISRNGQTTTKNNDDNDNEQDEQDDDRVEISTPSKRRLVPRMTQEHEEEHDNVQEDEHVDDDDDEDDIMPVSRSTRRSGRKRTLSQRY